MTVITIPQKVWYTMRQSLCDLIKNTIVYEYSLPNNDKGFNRIHISTTDDDCYSVADTQNLAEIIYNAVLDYSYDEFNLTEDTFKALLVRALKTKLKFNENTTQENKIKYGFYGEVLLYSLLYKIYGANCLISRGYFYNPLEYGETKGYDTYNIIENIETSELELWFGEVKFYIKYDAAIKKVMENINKALSNEYLERNILALVDFKDKVRNDKGKIKDILTKWENNPEIKLIDELKNNNMILVYPVCIIFDMENCTYDNCIQKVINHIKDKYPTINPQLTINYKLFFIFIPIQNAKQVKEHVLKWIEEKKPVLL